MFPEMSKQAFCKVLEESGVLKLPKVEETKKAAGNAKGKDSKKAAQEESKGQEEVKAPVNEVLFKDEDVLDVIRPV